MPSMRRKLFVTLLILAVLTLALAYGAYLWGVLGGRVAPGPL